MKDSFGGMEELSTKMRNQVKKSLKQLDIKVLTKDEMLNYGYESYRSAAANYKVKTKIPSIEEYNRWVMNAADDIEFWGCFIKDTNILIAIAKNRVHEDYVEYQVMKANPDYQKLYYPFYGLIYEMNRYYLESQGKSYVNDGARSITAHSNIQPFLIEKFKFKKAYCELNVYYQWWLKPIVNILLPFRKYINHPKIIALLNMEAMRRGIM